MSAIVWFYVQDDKRLGPVDLDHIVHLVITAALSPGALVWHPGLKEWTEAEKVPEAGKPTVRMRPRGPRDRRATRGRTAIREPAAPTAP